MNREELINKWLDNDLSDVELIELKKLDDYDELKKIVDSARFFADDTSFSFEDIETVLPKSPKKIKTRQISFSNKWLRVAAVLLIGLGVFFVMNLNSKKSINTSNGETLSLILPDDSSVKLNADSKLAYNESNWNENRTINLIGEALFEVEKGEQFTVQTDLGTVQVLGTKFNVFQREKYFEITCFKGSVSVKVKNEEVILKRGEGVALNSSGKLEKFYSQLQSANWLNGYVKFENKNLLFVVEELERQFDVKFVIDNDSIRSKHFSGTLFFNDLNMALKTLKSSLTIDYKIIKEEGKVILSETKD